MDHKDYNPAYSLPLVVLLPWQSETVQTEPAQHQRKGKILPDKIDPTNKLTFSSRLNKDQGFQRISRNKTT